MGKPNYSTIEGVISMLEVAEGKQNLLAGIQNRTAAAGAVAALTDQFGTAANAAMVALYDGEDVKHFGAVVNDQLIVGTFRRMDFKEGDIIKAIVTPQSTAYFAHAVIRQSDQRLWLPLNVMQGRAAALRNSFGLVGLLMLAVAVFFLLFTAIFSKDFLLVASLFLVGGVVIMTATLGSLLYKSSRNEAIYAEGLFNVLGFKKPRQVSIFSYVVKDYADSLNGHKLDNGYDLVKALEASN